MHISVFPQNSLLLKKENRQSPTITKEWAFLWNTPRAQEKQQSAFMICGSWRGREMSDVDFIDGIIIESEDFDFDEACKIPFFHMVKKSYSRKGVHCYIKIEKMTPIMIASDYTLVWYELVKIIQYFAPHFIHDTQTKNPNRLWFFGGETDETCYIRPDAKRLSLNFINFLNFFVTQAEKHESRRLAVFSILQNSELGRTTKENYLIQMNEWGMFKNATWKYQQIFKDWRNKLNKEPEETVETNEKTGNTSEMQADDKLERKQKIIKNKNKKALAKAKLDSIRELINLENPYWCIIRDKLIVNDMKKETFVIKCIEAGIVSPANFVDLIFSSPPEFKQRNLFLEVIKQKVENQSEIEKFLQKVQFETKAEMMYFLRLLRRMTIFHERGEVNKVGPCLIGQQNSGKTTLLRQIFSPFEDFYTEIGAKFSETKDDNIKLVNNIFVNVEEVRIMTENDYFKYLFSSNIIDYRPPYQAFEIRRKRVANFIMSANFLVFSENSTRIIPLRIQNIVFDIEINWTKFWQELYHAEQLPVDLSQTDWQEIWSFQNILPLASDEAAAHFEENKNNFMTSTTAFNLITKMYPDTAKRHFQIALQKRFKQIHHKNERGYFISLKQQNIGMFQSQK